METSKKLLLGPFYPPGLRTLRWQMTTLLLIRALICWPLQGQGSYRLSFLGISINPHCTLHANTCKIIEHYVHLMVKLVSVWCEDSGPVLAVEGQAAPFTSWQDTADAGILELTQVPRTQAQVPKKLACSPDHQAAQLSPCVFPYVIRYLTLSQKTKPPLHKWFDEATKTHDQNLM